MKELDELLSVVRRLRSENGCPWDRKQTFESMKASLLEEVYEFIDAVDSGDDTNMREEMGDALFNLVFYSVLAEETKRFNLAESLADVTAKLVRRHPHVFENQAVDGVEAALGKWNERKNEEKKRDSVLDGIPRSLPALMQAEAMQKKAASVGFDWPDAGGVIEKLREETAEFALAENTAQRVDETGDLLFTLVNLCRFQGVEAELTLKKANDKFRSRFQWMEARAKTEGRELKGLTLGEMEEMWQESKKDFP